MGVVITEDLGDLAKPCGKGVSENGILAIYNTPFWDRESK
jgi:hypothetical protein